jgi:alpha-L-fucosidase
MSNAVPPVPVGPAPSPRQLAWHGRDFYGFLHFTTNTFTDKEWGYGDEDPKIFHPTDFDPNAIAQVAREVGMKGLILTAKHHDGFCLWPTKTTDHHVGHSLHKKDVVKAFAAACRRHRIRFGVYLSPWDRHQASYGTPAYVEMYRTQLRELLTGYGPLFEIWHDGANGGDGFYGGARETRKIDKTRYYDWPKTWAMIRELQPDACVFSDAGPDIRWIGNEQGIAGDPCWATMRSEGLHPGAERIEGRLNAGERPGDIWLPGECDVSIRPGWFWHESENDRVRTPENLLDLYLKSVGRGASFLLNVPPDRRGRWHENDIAALRGFAKLRDALFVNELAKGRSPVCDTPITLKRPGPVGLVRIRELLPAGQRIEGWVLELRDGGVWKEAAAGQSIGNCRLVRLTPPMTADAVRLRVTKSSAPPMLSELRVYS